MELGRDLVERIGFHECAVNCGCISIPALVKIEFSEILINTILIGLLPVVFKILSYACLTVKARKT
jgi:hypothetical protein